MSEWVSFAKRASYTHNFKAHFLLSLNGHSKRLTVLLRPFLMFVRCPQVLGWSPNGPILPGQVDSQQRIITQLAIVRLGMDLAIAILELKTASIDTICLFLVLLHEYPTTSNTLIMNHDSGS